MLTKPLLVLPSRPFMTTEPLLVLAEPLLVLAKPLAMLLNRFSMFNL
jgi:hypothetical protein